MSATIIPLPGWAIHIWPSQGGWFGVDAHRGTMDPDFPPEGAPLFERCGDAFDQAVSINERTGFPIISHLEEL